MYGKKINYYFIVLYIILCIFAIKKTMRNKALIFSSPLILILELYIFSWTTELIRLFGFLFSFFIPWARFR